MSRARWSVLSLVGALLLSLLLAGGLTGSLVACDTTSSDSLVPPVTGISVQAETLIGTHGCGNAPSQVLKYAVVVYGLDAKSAADTAVPLQDKLYTRFLAANLYDCFTDGTFTNLPDTSGIYAYHLQVYAFNQAAYVAAGGDQLVSLMVDINAQQDVVNRALAAGTANADAAERVQADLATLNSKAPTYTTLCRAEQLSLVQTLAACDPLTLGTSDPDGGTPTVVTLALDAFTTTLPDGGAGLLSCGTDYAVVRVVTTVDGAPGPTSSDTGCSTGPLKISPAAAPSSYSFAVSLLKTDASTFGTTTCTAATSPNGTFAATCAPVK